MINTLLILFGKLFSRLSQALNLGNGSTWPGHIALTVNKHFVADVLRQSAVKTIVIAGTNGKTTTAKLIQTALEAEGKRVMQNQSGANLLNGIASTLILNTNKRGKLEKDFAIFEVDENSLPLFINEVKPDYLVLLNLFRDQLDRYGEINSITQKWHHSLSSLPSRTTLILNADDPQIAYLGNHSGKKYSPIGISSPLMGRTKEPACLTGVDEDEGADARSPLAHEMRQGKEGEKLQEHHSLKTFYYGLQPKRITTITSPDHAADSVYCPNCGAKLTYTSYTYSHLGIWHCPHCHLKRPSPNLTNFTYFPLAGQYNQYNTLAAALTLTQIGLKPSSIEQSFKTFQPAFGRQETIKYQNKNVQLFLSKNPTSFNQSYRTMRQISAHPTLLLILNDRIPDGRDVSWIWDIDLQGIESFKQIFIAGDRVYDMALRLKYELKDQNSKIKTFNDLKTAIDSAIDVLDPKDTLFILPTYSAMLDARKILTGKKIL